MDKFNVQIDKTKLKSKGIQTKFHITPKNKKAIGTGDIGKIVKDLYKKVHKDIGHEDFMVVARMGNIDRFHSFNVDENGELVNYSYDYYEGEVKHVAKFAQPHFIDLFVTVF